jgi:hypothetical protein
MSIFRLNRAYSLNAPMLSRFSENEIIAMMLIWWKKYSTKDSYAKRGNNRTMRIKFNLFFKINKALETIFQIHSRNIEFFITF